MEIVSCNKRCLAALVGTNGTKFPSIRSHLKVAIADCYKDMDVTLNGTFPNDTTVVSQFPSGASWFFQSDPTAYKAAIGSMSPGDAAIIFTPDDTHFDIAEYAIKKGLHVLSKIIRWISCLYSRPSVVTKPATKTLSHHLQLAELAKKVTPYSIYNSSIIQSNIHVQIEFHKRWDPIYLDAREKIRKSGHRISYHVLIRLF